MSAYIRKNLDYAIFTAKSQEQDKDISGIDDR